MPDKPSTQLYTLFFRTNWVFWLVYYHQFRKPHSICHCFVFLGFTISGGVPKVGQLLNAAWNLTDLCRFKLVTSPPPALHHSTSSTPEHRRGADSSGGNSSGPGITAASSLPAPGSSGNKNSLHKETADRLDMPPPPSPASSTCSDTGSITTSHSTCTCSSLILSYICIMSFEYIYVSVCGFALILALVSNFF